MSPIGSNPLSPKVLWRPFALTHPNGCHPHAGFDALLGQPWPGSWGSPQLCCGAPACLQLSATELNMPAP